MSVLSSSTQNNESMKPMRRLIVTRASPEVLHYQTILQSWNKWLYTTLNIRLMKDFWNEQAFFLFSDEKSKLYFNTMFKITHLYST